MRIVGIDPGISGALALVDFEEKTHIVIDLPTLGEGKQRELDARWLLYWVINQSPDYAYCELVTAMPSIPDADGKRRGMGAASAFKFGFAAGQLRAVLQCSRVPFALITSRTWKKHYGLKGPDKEKSRQLALRLFPAAAGDLKRKGDHQRAEALLIANYGWERMAQHALPV